jgi:hypothetical protein
MTASIFVRIEFVAAGHHNEAWPQPVPDLEQRNVYFGAWNI